MKLTIKHIAIIFLLAIANTGFAQMKTIMGKTLDKQNQPVEGTIVILYDNAQNIVSHSITDQMGTFTMEGELVAGYVLETSHLSYAMKQHILVQNELQQSTITIDFILEENMTTLDEIVFIAKRKKIDTVNFNLEKLNLLEDDNLQDILKKIPDFKLGNDGSIIYRGKNIDKILVNDKPSFENQNTIALESIEKNIIEGISLINNYSDDFTLDFSENMESVINIDTKNKGQNILSGDFETKYGFNEKYKLHGKGFLFSRRMNAFLTHRTNNIGQTGITSNELIKLFSEKQPFSNYLSNSMGSLFASSENLQKDFFTNSNLTLRNQSKRLKTSALIYHIAPNRINSIIQNVSTLNDTPLLNSEEVTESKSSSFLSAFSLAYKLTNRSILKYALNANYIDENNHGNTNIQSFVNGVDQGRNNLFSKNINNIFSGFHQLLLESKVRNNLILETKAAYFHEDTKFINDIKVLDSTSSIFEAQNFNFGKRETQGSVGLKYKLSNAFIPLLSINYFDTEETIVDQKDQQKLVNREIQNYLLNLKIIGNDVIFGLDYGAEIGINPVVNTVNSDLSENSAFIPMTFWVEYEKRMHRYYIRGSSTRVFNDLESGIKTIQPFNNIWYGDLTFPMNYSTTNKVRASYNYNNLFDAELFSIFASFGNLKNSLKRGFIKQQNGISEFQLFVAENTQEITIGSFYSKTLFPLKYPTKFTLSVDYSNTRYPLQIVQQEVNITNTSITPKFDIETITDNFMNFKYSSSVNFINDIAQGASYKGTYTNNTFSIVLKNNTWRGNIDFLYDHNMINSNIYTRKNINLGISYSVKNMVFSIEARHIGELLNIFQNDAYNSQFFLRNGITSTIINDQSLNYALAGIKFKL